MFDFILSLPDFLGGLLMMSACTVTGLTVYLISSKFIAKYQTSDLKDPAGALFRVIGILVSLMLSLAFGQVVVEWRDIQNAIKGEVAAIADISVELEQLQTAQAKKLHSILIDYTEAVIYDDWPALAHDNLGQLATFQLHTLLFKTNEIEAVESAHKGLKTNIQSDIDKVINFRLARLNNALAQPPVYIFITFIGFLVTMIFFGCYPPQVPIVILVSIYTSFVGAILYLILTLSDPFQGSISMPTNIFNVLVEYLRAVKM